MHFSALPRKLLGRCLANVQRTSLYRLASSHKRRRVKILEASDADLEEVHEIFDLEVEPSPPGDHDTVNYVAVEREVIVGFAQLVKHSDVGKLDKGYYLFSLNVRLPYRGLGIGRDLTKLVMARAKAEGATELSVITREDNRRALGLFHELGFRLKRIEVPGEKGDKRTSAQNRKKFILARALVD